MPDAHARISCSQTVRIHLHGYTHCSPKQAMHAKLSRVPGQKLCMQAPHRHLRGHWLCVANCLEERLARLGCLSDYKHGTAT